MHLLCTHTYNSSSAGLSNRALYKCTTVNLARTMLVYTKLTSSCSCAFSVSPFCAHSNRFCTQRQFISKDMQRRLSVTNYSSENNLSMFRLNAPVIIRVEVVIIFGLMMTGAFSRNVDKLFFKLKLVIDNLLYMYAEVN